MPQEVKLYTTPTCVPCKAVKRFFDERGVDFTEIDVAADRVAMQELVRISGNITVPVVTIDGDVVVGFDKARMEELLLGEDA
ncbi:MAG: glutaredoxin family protein [Nitrospinae bacterium]|nr:glutaredoxin family protein [Nitrospinota bacterium]MCH7767324.1 glutaredoxin family protein [Nitrospinota bacterium]